MKVGFSDADLTDHSLFTDDRFATMRKIHQSDEHNGNDSERKCETQRCRKPNSKLGDRSLDEHEAAGNHCDDAADCEETVTGDGCLQHKKNNGEKYQRSAGPI